MARAWADVDLGAVRHNVGVLRRHVAPARLCVVVKADGYGHGAVAVAGAALEAGAEWLAVAQAGEAVALRDAGIDAPLLLLSEPRADEVATVVGLDIRLTVYTAEMVAALAEAATSPLRLHLKVDTGMRRVGVAPDEAVALAKLIADHPELELEGVFTHLPVADEPGNPFTGQQVARFDAVLDQLRSEGVDPPLRHAANSAAALRVPEARYDLVRCGIAVYGVPPAPVLDGLVDLRGALSLSSEVSFVKRVPGGQGVSYGLRQRTRYATLVATVPIGYADGVFRSLPLAGAEVLVHGRRRRMIGVVTMDQLMIDCGSELDVRPGDPVVLLGAQGDERITPDEWAEKLGTISYEVVCAIGPRVERRYPG
ncbi:MAG TPA: alanine racemase [Acidimicrobiales bacterium]|nr:alanine racemase [Acidimicrobiales bacterium]